LGPSGEVVVTNNLVGTADIGTGPVTSQGLTDVFVAKFASDGTPMWSKAFGDAQAQYSRCAAIDSHGNVILTGMYDGTPDFGLGPLPDGIDDLYMAKLDETGQVLWSKGYADFGAGNIWGLFFDPQDNLVMLGGSTGGTLDYGSGSIELASGVFLAKVKP
jgi:hypothetical protein